MNTKLKNASGFTIIEVLIVLAIAALIILIVFLAVPALRRNQQNTTMRNEASRLLSAATEYESNANGAQVTAAQMANVYNGAFPGGAQQLTPQTAFGGAAPTADGASRLVVGTCVGTTATAGGAGTRTYALEFQLRGGQHSCLQS